MSTDLPAMRRFKDALVDVPRTAYPDAVAAYLVDDVEAEGNALIGGVQCGNHHGVEDPEGNVVPCACKHDHRACPNCGAAL